MALLCKQSTAITVMVFAADSADGITGKAGLTLAITISKAGGAYGSISPTVTDRGNGNYSVALTSSETDTLGQLSLRATATGAHPIDALNIVNVVSFDPYDAVRAGLTALPNAAAEAAGGLYTRGTGAGQIKQSANGQIDANLATWNLNGTTASTTVPAALTSAGLAKADMIAVSGDSTAADNLEATYDGTGYVNGKAPATQDSITTLSSDAASGLASLQADTADIQSKIGTPAGASVSADVAAVKSDTGAIKTKADQLTFTVANQVDANALTGGGGGGGTSAGYGEQRIEQGASQPIHFTLLDADGARVAEATSAINAMISINGGTPVAATGTFHEIDSSDQPGEYYYTPDTTEDSGVGTLVLYLTPDADDFVPCSVMARVVGPSTVDNEAIADQVDTTLSTSHGEGNWSLDATSEGSVTIADAFRLMAGVLAGAAIDFTTNTIVFKSLDGSKTRLTVVRNATGRISCTIGDLTP